DQTHDEHLYGNDADSNRQGEQHEQSLKPDTENGEGLGGEAGHSVAPPDPLSGSEREQLSIQWRQRLAGAAQQAMQAGKLGGNLLRLVDHLLAPQLPWRMLLARYLTAASRDDYSYMRPSRREGSAIFPTLRSGQTELLVVLDTSGSIKPAEMREFVTELDAIKGQVRARITLHACDAELAANGPWVFEPWEEFEMPGSLRGGGGTRFTPVFDWLQQAGQKPDLLVYFTDAEGEFPQQEPDFPVIWLVKGRGKVPWGQRIQLN
ncbi:MAG: VWA-like domain-containing protein, partial [Gammaproteobacteria bacterium]|nr:VWA-like domain-containing protein [Gammaproteobacteria bacterium]